jgi:hypothetical protein
LIAAVPEPFSCAVPSSAELVQYVAVASQKVTTPGETAAPPLVFTVAVNVTAVPEFTALEDGARVVVVAVAAKLRGIATVAARSSIKLKIEFERKRGPNFI